MVNGEWIMVNGEWCDVTGLLIKSRTRIEQFEGGPPRLAKAKHRREMSIGSEDHISTESFGKTHIPLRRGTAARSEGEAAQGDVGGG